MNGWLATTNALKLLLSIRMSDFRRHQILQNNPGRPSATGISGTFAAVPRRQDTGECALLCHVQWYGAPVKTMITWDDAYYPPFRVRQHGSVSQEQARADNPSPTRSPAARPCGRVPENSTKYIKNMSNDRVGSRWRRGMFSKNKATTVVTRSRHVTSRLSCHSYKNGSSHPRKR